MQRIYEKIQYERNKKEDPPLDKPEKNEKIDIPLKKIDPPSPPPPPPPVFSPLHPSPPSSPPPPPSFPPSSSLSPPSSNLHLNKIEESIDWEEKLYSYKSKLNKEVLIQVLRDFSSMVKEIAIYLLENNFSHKFLEEREGEGIRYFFDQRNNLEVFISCNEQQSLSFEEVFNKKKFKMEKKEREAIIYEGKEFRYFGNCNFFCSLFVFILFSV